MVVLRFMHYNRTGILKLERILRRGSLMLDRCDRLLNRRGSLMLDRCDRLLNRRGSCRLEVPMNCLQRCSATSPRFLSPCHSNFFLLRGRRPVPKIRLETKNNKWLESELRIHVILGWIRIRGSMPLTNVRH